MKINYGIRKDNITFSAAYSLKGTPEEIAQAYKIIVERNLKDNYATDFLDLQSDNTCRIVVPGHGKLLKNQLDKLMTEIKNGLVVIAKDILDSRKLMFFDALNGHCRKKINVTAEGMEFICGEENYNEPRPKVIYSVIFDKVITLAEGLQKLINLEKNLNKKEFKFFYKMSGKLDEIKEVVESSEKLRNLRMIAYKGSGAVNAVIELTNDQILKLSTSPNFPKKTKSVELPILDSGVINYNIWGSPYYAYYHIQPKALNSSETNITPEMVESMRKRMKAEGIESQDLRPDQLGVYDGKVYLLDTGCIEERYLVE